MRKRKTIGWQPQTKGKTQFRLNNASELLLALAWTKQLSNNPDNLSNQEATQNQGNTTAPKPQETMATTTQSTVGRSHTPSMDRGELSQQMWISTTHQHPWAHSAHHSQCDYWRTYTGRERGRTNSQPICKERDNQSKKGKKPPSPQRRDPQHSNEQRSTTTTVQRWATG